MLHNCFLFQRLEPVVHGRGRKTDNLDETYLGVYEELLYARKLNPVEGTFYELKTEDSLFFFLEGKSICIINKLNSTRGTEG